MHGLSPNYLHDLVPPLVQETSNYSLRNANNIQTLLQTLTCSIILSSHRPFEHGILSPKKLNRLRLFQLLKKHLNTNIKRPPKYYYAGTRLGQVLHARLRMECSSLNSHLYHKNIGDCPSCLCGGFESTYHFLFVCPRFAAARNSYLLK